MTKENAHLYLPLVQALTEGKTIQHKAFYSQEWEDKDNAAFNDDLSRYRIKPEPVMVPLGPEDIEPGSAIRNNSKTEWVIITSVGETGIHYRLNAYLSYSALMDGHQIKRPGGTWQPCSKPAP